MRRVLRSLVLLAVALLGMNLGGCAALLGVAGDLPTATEAGFSLFKRGKFETYDQVPFERVVPAVEQAARELSLHLIQRKIRSDHASLKYEDDRKQEIAVTVRRRSATVTGTRIDVGLFGELGMGRIMLAALLRELLAEGTPPRGRSPTGSTLPGQANRPASSAERQPQETGSGSPGDSGILLPVPTTGRAPAITVEPSGH